MIKQLISIIYFLNIIISSNSITIDKSRNFVDDQGRSLIFHGVNVVYKLPPYIPILDKFDPFNSLAEEDIAYLKRYGFNLVRLGVIWVRNN
jgi:endoglycosylceramidase